jgi:RZZ complex, subunit zwilch
VSSKGSPALNQSGILDLTGSPLKDDGSFVVMDVPDELKLASTTPWLIAEECYCPLKISDARNILQTVANERFTDSSGSVWVLTNGKDDRETLLLEHAIEKGWSVRGVVRCTGQTPLKSITMAVMLEQHFALIKNVKVDTQLELVYNIRSNQSIRLNTNNQSPQPSLQVHNKNTDVTLLQSVAIEGLTSSLAKDTWYELFVLNTLKVDIDQYKKGDGKGDPEYRIGGASIELEILMDKIVKILSDVEIVNDESASTEGLNSQLEIACVTVKNRLALDLTDRLWDILKCKSKTFENSL